jgi:hypothetical protein
VEVANANRAAILCFLICLSPAYYGYALTIIGASSYSQLQNYYGIDLLRETALALMNGALPIGGMLGCLLFPKLRLLATKKYSALTQEAALLPGHHFPHRLWGLRHALLPHHGGLPLCPRGYFSPVHGPVDQPHQGTLSG